MKRFIVRLYTAIICKRKRTATIAINEEQILALSSQLEKAMAKYQQMLANIPPDQREMTKKTMPKLMPQGIGEEGSEAAFEVRGTSEKSDIYGYPTRKYEV
ncbi:MAG: hypothetical protein HN763_00525 [Opitutales bacterium]|nr:hypothetical protein [Opitutales bacterium]